MEFKKTHLVAMALILVVVVVAYLGYSAWNGFIIPNVGKISSLPLPLILGFALVGGILSFFSPCGLALLPALLSYQLGETTNLDKKKVVKISAACSLGIITFYSVLGISAVLVGSLLFEHIQTLQFLFAAALIVLGVMTFKRMSINIPFVGVAFKGIQGRIKRGIGGSYLFGFGYGLANLGCTAPLVSVLIIFPFISGSIFLGIASFLTYAIALGLMVGLTLLYLAFSKNTYLKKVMESSDKIKKISGAGMIFAGIVLLAYYLFFSMRILSG